MPWRVRHMPAYLAREEAPGRHGFLAPLAQCAADAPVCVLRPERQTRQGILLTTVQYLRRVDSSSSSSSSSS
jgi:hypothetical protein